VANYAHACSPSPWIQYPELVDELADAYNELSIPWHMLLPAFECALVPQLIGPSGGHATQVFVAKLLKYQHNAQQPCIQRHAERK
jgi:hypothetical protein